VRHGAGVVTVRIRPHDTDDGTPYVAVDVLDEGEGVADELHARIFTKFWRSGRRGGTGLGLYIVHGLVEAHGGEVSVGRAPGGGAVFSVRFPAGTPEFAR
jgi:signal transduction histidine kinase